MKFTPLEQEALLMAARALDRIASGEGLDGAAVLAAAVVVARLEDEPKDRASLRWFWEDLHLAASQWKIAEEDQRQREAASSAALSPAEDTKETT